MDEHNELIRILLIDVSITNIQIKMDVLKRVNPYANGDKFNLEIVSLMEADLETTLSDQHYDLVLISGSKLKRLEDNSFVGMLKSDFDDKVMGISLDLSFKPIFEKSGLDYIIISQMSYDEIWKKMQKLLMPKIKVLVIKTCTNKEKDPCRLLNLYVEMDGRSLNAYEASENDYKNIIEHSVFDAIFVDGELLHRNRKMLEELRVTDPVIICVTSNSSDSDLFKGEIQFFFDKNSLARNVWEQIAKSVIKKNWIRTES